jgi:hypothetical protein
MIPICTESQVCVITKVSDPNARFQFGAGNTWCQTFNTPKLPTAVSYTPPNLSLCSYNPAVTDKTLSAQQRNSTYFVTYTLAGITQPVKTIPGLLTVPTIVASWNCDLNQMSDGTFTSIAGSCVKK